MKPLRRLSVVEQIAGHLRDELGRGRWRGKMPGAIQLAAELAASSKTTEAALRLLEAEGLLSGQGPQGSEANALPRGIHQGRHHRPGVATIVRNRLGANRFLTDLPIHPESRHECEPISYLVVVIATGCERRPGVVALRRISPGVRVDRMTARHSP
jgi:hypothetical protein